VKELEKHNGLLKADNDSLAEKVGLLEGLNKDKDAKIERLEKELVEVEAKSEESQEVNEKEPPKAKGGKSQPRK
jgi:SMC interacting uncharacterized protein involved in chromosome segregation